jgi:hypothetical protein
LNEGREGVKVKTLIRILTVFILLGTHAIAAEKIVSDNEASKYMSESVAVRA